MLFSTSILLTKFADTDKTVLQFILYDYGDPYDEPNDIEVNDIRVIQEIIKSEKYYLLSYANVELYNEYVAPGKTVLDVMLEHKVVPYIEKINIFGDMSKFQKQQSILFRKIRDNKTLFRILLENGYELNLNYFSSFDDYEIISLLLDCYDTKHLELLKGLPENILARKVENKLVIVYLLKANVIPYFTQITNVDVATKLLLTENQEMCELLLSKATEDVLLSSIGVKKKNTIIYLIYGLMQNDKKFKEILFKRSLNTPAICLELAKGGIIIKPNEKSSEAITKEQNIDNYLYGLKNNGELSEDEKMGIKYFYEAFDTPDNPSDKSLLDLVVASFIANYKKDMYNASKDLIGLIDFKEKYPNFCFKYDKSSQNMFLGNKYFKGKNCCIILNNNKSIMTLDHEWTHALHYFYNDNSIPDEMFSTLVFIKEFTSSSEKIRKIYEDLLREGEKRNDSSHYTEEYASYISQTYGSISKYKQVLQEDFRRLIKNDPDAIVDFLNINCYSSEVAEAIRDCLAGEASPDIDTYAAQYAEERAKIEEKMFVFKIYTRDNQEFMEFENLLDAIYGGKIGNIYFQEKQSIPFSTHNEEYFDDYNMQFQEMLADYVALLKSPNGSYYLNKLKGYGLGRTVEILDKYYKDLGKNHVESLEKNASEMTEDPDEEYPIRPEDLTIPSFIDNNKKL